MLLFAEGPIFVVEQTEASERQEPLTAVLLPRSRAVPSWPPVISFPEASPVLSLFTLPSPSPNVSLRSRETDADRTPVVVMGSSCVLYHLPGANCLRDPCTCRRSCPCPILQMRKLRLKEVMGQA